MEVKLIRKIKDVGFINTIVGGIKLPYYTMLQKEVGFPAWHTHPYELRGYNIAVAKYVNKKRPDSVVEIGCGVGEVLRHIDAPRRIGIDHDDSVLEGARRLDRKHKISFKRGALGEITGQSADYLIMLGFLQSNDLAYWKPALTKTIQENSYHNIILDIIRGGEILTSSPNKRPHELDFDEYLGGFGYHLSDKLGPFLSGRYIMVYSR